MTRCYKCKGTSFEEREETWPVALGGHEVAHKVRVNVCTSCGEWTLSADALEHLELQTASKVLGEHALTGAVLRDIRKVLGLKQTELGEELGIATETISRWEGDKRPMESWVKAALWGLVLNATLPHIERKRQEQDRKHEAFLVEMNRRQAEIDAKFAELDQLRRARRS
jgi:putative zinc finger/helix-turn-helix YgiT family protein